MFFERLPLLKSLESTVSNVFVASFLNNMPLFRTSFLNNMPLVHLSVSGLSLYILSVLAVFSADMRMNCVRVSLDMRRRLLLPFEAHQVWLLNSFNFRSVSICVCLSSGLLSRSVDPF